MATILLVDGNNLLFRAYYATAHVTENAHIFAVYTFVRMLKKHLQTYSYFDVVVAFDKSAKSFRKELYPEYKAGRRRTPKTLLDQFAIAKEFLKSSNITYFEKENYEADDIIATLAHGAVQKHHQVIIWSADHDFWQLVGPSVMVLKPKKQTQYEIITEEKVYQIWGISPSQVCDFKGIAGDSADNLKGVKGMGPGAAKALLNKYQTLENIIAHIDELSPKHKLLLEASLESAKMCKQLAKFNCRVPMKAYQFKKAKIDFKKQKLFFKKYQFDSLLN